MSLERPCSPPLAPFIGSANLRGEIIKFVVAQDLFDLCAPELQPATVALKKAILKWAGADQAGAVQLVREGPSTAGLTAGTRHPTQPCVVIVSTRDPRPIPAN